MQNGAKQLSRRREAGVQIEDKSHFGNWTILVIYKMVGIDSTFLKCDKSHKLFLNLVLY